MANRVIRVRDSSDDALRQQIAKIRAEQKLPDGFPDEVERAAEQAAAGVLLPEEDRTDLPFVTIDPESAMDLDQAMFLERDADGYVVHYAIADLTAFITPGDPIDLEARRRGETLYGADSKIPLHPKRISEDAGSLLPDQVRPAFVWTIRLAKDGQITDGTVVRAAVKSRAKLSYDQVQADLDAGKADEMFTLLQEIGELRIAQETQRGGVNLPMPEQEIKIDGDQWSLEFRGLHPVETWNAQISLLTGIVAAQMMVEAKVGVLRTLPPAEKFIFDRLRNTAKGLRVDWPAGLEFAEFVRTLDPNQPHHAAMVVACTSVLRGAGYACFDGELPENTQQAALATEYAHVTAPLRRLVDRFALATCAALAAGEPVPGWVTGAFADLPETMQESGRRANTYENAILNLVEATVLKDSVGQSFEGVVLESDHKDPNKGDVQIDEPAVEASVTSTGPVPVGERVRVTLAKADPANREIAFTL